MMSAVAFLCDCTEHMKLMTPDRIVSLIMRPLFRLEDDASCRVSLLTCIRLVLGLLEDSLPSDCTSEALGYLARAFVNSLCEKDPVTQRTLSHATGMAFEACQRPFFFVAGLCVICCTFQCRFLEARFRMPAASSTLNSCIWLLAHV